ncbi:unnamed protein product [Pleuronectes platessa]|uniref:Un-named sa821 n=1 Tax=Pleuronectes platessa TaxID=8262 RepID=A0A9N7Z4K0_PLEPL|nr:unnamed protein product [Pleuronectes platessa]
MCFNVPSMSQRHFLIDEEQPPVSNAPNGSFRIWDIVVSYLDVENNVIRAHVAALHFSSQLFSFFFSPSVVDDKRRLGRAHSLDLFTYPQHYHEDIESIYIPHGVIMNRVERLAHYIKDDFGDGNIMVLCVLKGGYKFCVDLVEFLKILGRNSNKYLETRVEFIRLKSYLVGDVHDA